MPTPHAAPDSPRGCRACGRPFSATTAFGPPLCPGCEAQAWRSGAAALRQVRDSLEALLDTANANSLLPLYTAAREGVASLVRLEASGALAGGGAAWLARRMDDSREEVLSLALRHRLGAGGGPSRRRQLAERVNGFLQDLDEVAGQLRAPAAGESPAPSPALEHRDHFRTPLVLPVQLEPGNREGTTRDLSPGGAFVCCSPQPAVGQRLTLTFHRGAERHSAEGRVRWSAPEGVGVEFAREQVGAPFDA